MEKGAWQATVLGITELNMTEYTHLDTHTHITFIYSFIHP